MDAKEAEQAGGKPFNLVAAVEITVSLQVHP